MRGSCVIGRPDSIFSRGKDTLRVQSILDSLVEPHENVVVPIIGPCNLIHQCKMSSILPPTVSSTIGN